MNLYPALLFLVAISFQLKYAASKKDWKWTPMEANLNISTPDTVECDWFVERIGRGQYGITGFTDWKVDLYDDFEVEITSAFSATGNPDDYKKTPMEIPRTSLSDIMNNYYKTYVMNGVEECSPSAPRFETFVPPLKAQKVTYDKCDFDFDMQPDHVTPGFYKIMLRTFGPVETYAELIVKVESAYI